MRVPNRTGRPQYAIGLCPGDLSAFSHCIDTQGTGSVSHKAPSWRCAQNSQNGTKREAAPGFLREQPRGGRAAQRQAARAGKYRYKQQGEDHDTC